MYSSGRDASTGTRFCLSRFSTHVRRSGDGALCPYRIVFYILLFMRKCTPFTIYTGVTGGPVVG